MKKHIIHSLMYVEYVSTGIMGHVALHDFYCNMLCIDN